MAKKRRFLQFPNHPELAEVRFTESLPCPETPLTEGRIWMKVVHFTAATVKFSYQQQSNNRAIQSLDKGSLLLADFEQLRFVADKGRPTPEYVARVLNAGVVINGVRYGYFGQSNSQLRQRKCLLCRADDDAAIQRLLDRFGKWSGFTSVAKLTKRVGLLFSAGEKVLDLPAANYELIDDVERNGHCFTDGCGFASGTLVRKVSKRLRLAFRDRRYYPSVLQVRYHGFKGILLRANHLRGTSCQFRHSMNKFESCGPDDFFVVDRSKPYTFGRLNTQTVMLLSSLGVPDDAFVAKQAEHFERLEAMFHDPAIALEYLLTSGELQLAADLFENGFTDKVVQCLHQSFRQEMEASLKTRRAPGGGDDAVSRTEKLRILVRESRIVFAAADPTGRLRPGECFFRPTLHNEPTTVTGPLFCVRNPCYHAGDVLVLQAVHLPDCDHLLDVLLFSTEGEVPAAHRSAGGDLDGDKFFVCWDPDLMPPLTAPSYGYPGVAERPNPNIKRSDVVHHFANHSNAAVARCADLFLKWAEARGPRCDECLEINALFSQAVDGSSVRVPEHLKQVPAADAEVVGGRIWNRLVTIAEAKRAASELGRKPSLLLKMEPDQVAQFVESDCAEATDYELLNFLIRWCRANHAQLADFLYLLDYSHFTSYQRLEAAATVPHHFLYNGLYMSQIVDEEAIFRFGLGDTNWKLFHTSSRNAYADQVSFSATLVHDLYRALTGFRRVLLVLRCGHELAFAIAFRGPFEPHTENVVEDAVHVYGFEVGGQMMRDTACRRGYRLTFSEGHFQLYVDRLTSTFVWLGLPQHLQTRVVSLNELCIQSQVSIALNRLSRDVFRTTSRIRRNEICQSEIYVVSNRDGVCTRYRLVNPEYSPEEEATDVDAGYKPPDPTEPESERDAQLLALASVPVQELIECLQCWLRYGLCDKAVLALRDHLKGQADPSQMERLAEFASGNPVLHGPLIEHLSQSSGDGCSGSTLALLLGACLKAARRSQEPLIMEKAMRLLNAPVALSVAQALGVVTAMVVDYSDPKMALEYLEEFFYLLEKKLADLEVASPVAVAYVSRQLRLLCMQTLEEFLATKRKPRPGSAVANRYRARQTDRPNRFVLVSVGTDVVAMRPGDVLTLKRLNRKSSEPIARLRAVVYSTDHGAHVDVSWVPRDVDVATWKVKNVGNVVGFRLCVDALLRLCPPGPDGLSPLLQRLLEPERFSEPEVADGVPPPDCGTLNPSQRAAVATAEAGSLTLWQGPAGTGKTQSIYQLILHLLEGQPKLPVLVTAATNAAVDNIAKLLVEREVAVVRIGDLKSILPELHPVTLEMSAEGRFRRMDSKKAQKLLKAAAVICATCVGCGSALLEKFAFEFVVVDEASQVAEPVCLVPLAKRCGRFVLVGDHRQLRPFCMRGAEEAGYNVSLFERLVHGSYPVCLLDTQYRMHPGISSFPNACFYGGRLRDGVGPSDRPPVDGFAWPSPNVPVAFVQVSGREASSKGSKYNEAEVERVAATVAAVLERGMAPRDIGVVSLYAAQVERMKTALRGAAPTARNVEVKTADGFQGREKELIVITCVRCNQIGEIGFLKDEHRFNVMLTRAKRGLIVVGDRATLCTNDMWKKWFQWIDSNQLTYS